jgi:hypothetical protein
VITAQLTPRFAIALAQSFEFVFNSTAITAFDITFATIGSAWAIACGRSLAQYMI